MTTLPALAVRLDAEAASAIAAAALAAYPNEACGLLIGSTNDAGWRVKAAVAGPNVHPEPRRRFEVDPKLVFAWMRKLRGSTDSLIGHFHSHPDGPAEPSTTDRDSAYDRNALWLIAAVTRGGVRGIRAYQLGKGPDPIFLEVPIASPAPFGGAGPGA